MDIFIQIVLDLIMDGSLGTVSDKRAPLALRVIAAVLLAAAFCGLIGFCVYLMIKDANWYVKVLGGLILLIALHAAYRFFKMYRQRTDSGHKRRRCASQKNIPNDILNCKQLPSMVY